MSAHRNDETFYPSENDAIHWYIPSAFAILMLYTMSEDHDAFVVIEPISMAALTKELTYSKCIFRNFRAIAGLSTDLELSGRIQISPQKRTLAGEN
jgi:hypothetical protein